LDKQYDTLRLEGDERRRMHFHERVENIKSAPDGLDRIEREGRFVKRKIEELEIEAKQMEGNMGMFNFKSASGAAMRADMEKKIEKARLEVARLKEQLKALNRELRGPAKGAEATPAATAPATEAPAAEAVAEQAPVQVPAPEAAEEPAQEPANAPEASTDEAAQ
jgi:chromosome segregation ATPase